MFGPESILNGTHGALCSLYTSWLVLQSYCYPHFYYIIIIILSYL